MSDNPYYRRAGRYHSGPLDGDLAGHATADTPIDLRSFVATLVKNQSKLSVEAQRELVDQLMRRVEFAPDLSRRLWHSDAVPFNYRQVPRHLHRWRICNGIDPDEPMHSTWLDRCLECFWPPRRKHRAHDQFLRWRDTQVMQLLFAERQVALALLDAANRQLSSARRASV